MNKKTIPKLTKLKNPESFIQIDTIKGFKYIDRAGEIINQYCDNGHKHKVGLEGLFIKKPRNKIDTLRVTSQNIWTKFTKIDSLDSISSLFEGEANSILDILEVKEVSRVGWRNYFVHEFSSEEAQDKYFKKFTTLEKAKPTIIRFELETDGNFNANLTIQPVTKEDDEKTSGVMFDIDVFKKGVNSRREISKILKEIRLYLADENGFLNLVNNTFK